jgi:hypothetical protein
MLHFDLIGLFHFKLLNKLLQDELIIKLLVLELGFIPFELINLTRVAVDQGLVLSQALEDPGVFVARAVIFPHLVFFDDLFVFEDDLP